MADPTMADLQLFYSGAGSNSTTTASIGGAISSARILSQTASALTTITGVTINDAMGNTVGDGVLTFTASGKTLSWTPAGGSAGTAVAVGTDGVYFLQGAGTSAGALCVTVVASGLSGSNLTNTVTIANQTDKFFLDQTKAESDAGVTKYHCFAIKNTHASLSMVGIKLFIAENTPGLDNCTLFLDGIAAGAGGTGPTAVANENTAPAASTFVAPDSATHADALAVGTLTTGQCRFFWVKQVTPAGCTVATTANTFKLGIYMRA